MLQIRFVYSDEIQQKCAQSVHFRSVDWYSFHSEIDYRADRFLKITIMGVNHADKSKDNPFRKDIFPQPNILMNMHGYIWFIYKGFFFKARGRSLKFHFSLINKKSTKVTYHWYWCCAWTWEVALKQLCVLRWGHVLSLRRGHWYSRAWIEETKLSVCNLPAQDYIIFFQQLLFLIFKGLRQKWKSCSVWECSFCWLAKLSLMPPLLFKFWDFIKLM